MTLLLVAVSFAYGGYCVIRGAQAAPVAASRPTDPTGSLDPATSPSGQIVQVEATPQTADASLSTTEAQALDAQLRAIEEELESLQISEDPGDAAIEEGLE